MKFISQAFFRRILVLLQTSAFRTQNDHRYLPMTHRDYKIEIVIRAVGLRDTYINQRLLQAS
jgi:hypothetical protein